jgi:hypothetical protein
MVGEIVIENDGGRVVAVFKLHGIDRILAIKNELRVPIEHIIDVSTERVDWDMFNQVRIVGTALPGVVKDGRFVSKEGWLFYEMHDPNKCLTVTLKDERYKKVIFEVADKEYSANQIRQAMNKQ